jgi:hypothetical protein
MMQGRLIGGRWTGTRWRWRSKRARLVHRLAVRLGLIAPPVVRPNPYAMAMMEALEASRRDFERAMLRRPRLFTDSPGKPMVHSWADCEFAPYNTSVEPRGVNR